MYLIRNHLQIPIDNDRCILVHTLTGEMFLLNEKEYSILQSLEHGETIDLQNEDISSFVFSLRNKLFILDSDDEEKNMEKGILEQCRKRHAEQASIYNYAAFVLSYDCNYRCPYCYEKGSSPNKSKIMNEEMVDAVFALHNGTITSLLLYGGEPLLPQNEKIIRYIINKAPQAQYFVITNGYYLTEYYPIIKNLSIGNIMVTLDGEEELHNQTRIMDNGGKTFAKIMEGIDLYLKNNITVKIRMNVHKKNVQSCLRLRETLISFYNDAYNNGSLLFEMQALFQLDAKERIGIEAQIYYPVAGMEGFNPMDQCDNEIVNSLPPLLSVFSKPRKFMPRYCNCPAEISARIYDPFGDIYSCLVAVGNKRAVVGEYYPEVKYKSISMINRCIETVPECSACKLKFLCGGGCANKALLVNNDILTPNCTQIQTDIEHSIPYLCRTILANRK